MYVGPGGLTATGSQLWHQDSSGIPESAELHDYFGDAPVSSSAADQTSENHL